MIMRIFKNREDLPRPLVYLPRIRRHLVRRVPASGMDDDIVTLQKLDPILNRALTLLGRADPEPGPGPPNKANRVRSRRIGDDRPLPRAWHSVEEVRDAVDLTADLVGLLVDEQR